MNTELKPAFGTYHAKTYMTGEVKAVWGARLIAPDDLLYDRQDLVATDDESKQALIAWLNGAVRGQGAIKQALEFCREQGMGTGCGVLDGSSNNSMVVFEDEQGMMVASPQGSYGYVYITGWLKS